MSRYYIFFLLLLASCKNPNSQKMIELAKTPETAYQRFLNTLTLNKKAFLEKYKGSDPFSTEQMAALTDYWVKMVSDSFYYYWKGTPYIVYGKPREPGQGPICGERLMAHIFTEMGLPVEYEKISHYSTRELQFELGYPDKIDDMTSLSPQAFDRYITRKGKGVYLIALGVQGGLIINDGTTNYLLYVNMGYGVTKERLDTSYGINTSIYKRTICLTSNMKLMRDKWLSLRNP